MARVVYLDAFLTGKLFLVKYSDTVRKTLFFFFLFFALYVDLRKFLNLVI